METVTCDKCKKVFYRKHSQVLLAKQHYCSTKCQHEVRINGEKKTCFTCGGTVYRQKRWLKKNKHFFCGRKCSLFWIRSEFKEEKHPNWTTGKSSYRQILRKRNVPRKCFLCKTVDLRILAVHHIDRNRENNKDTNLLWLCHNCHHLAHHYDALAEKST